VSNFPNVTAVTVTVVKLGKSANFKMACLLKGNIPVPVFLKPAWMSSTVQLLSHAVVKTWKKCCRPTFLPAVSLVNCNPSVVQFVYRLLNTETSAGCSMWLVCGGKQNTSTLLDAIIFRKSRLYTWLPWPSKSKTCFCWDA